MPISFMNMNGKFLNKIYTQTESSNISKRWWTNLDLKPKTQDRVNIRKFSLCNKPQKQIKWEEPNNLLNTQDIFSKTYIPNKYS